MQLTDAQSELIDAAGTRFVEACPGAGKTMCIASRFERLSSAEGRKGIALLSFTNAAVDELGGRAAKRAGLLDAPNYVGTFDSFVNRFIVGPLYATRFTAHPRFIESWEEIPNARVTNSELQQKGFFYDLEWFEFDADGSCELVPGRITGKLRLAMTAAYPAHAEALCDSAKKLRARLMKAGRLSCSASRWLASRALADENERAIIGALLASRFAEIIVDEAQDCGPIEIEILELAHELDIPVVAVGDLDQSIYGFRDAVPSEVSKFADNIGRGTRLDGNFRSSPAICKINQSLRSGAESDEALGSNQAIEHGVQILVFDEPGGIAAQSKTLIDRFGLNPDDSIVVAHGASTARSAAGGMKEESTSNRMAMRFARASMTLRSRKADSREIRRAVASAERALLDLGVESTANKPISEACDALGLDERMLRDLAVRICLGLNPLTLSRTDYAKAIRDLIETSPLPASVELKKLSDPIKAAPVDTWNEVAEHGVQPILPWATIHTVKGREFPAVVMTIPKSLRKNADDKTVVDLWEEGGEDEPRRVLYVGASRAEKLLVVAVHTDHVNRIEAILTASEVPFDRVELKPLS